MRSSFLAGILAFLATAASAADLTKLPANTFVEIAYSTEQPAGGDERDRGRYASQGWNKLIYDVEGHRVLLYDRWVDMRHGGQTIYGNCLFAFDPAAGKMAPLKIDNWTKTDTKTGGYRTLALPDNDDETTPCPRHVYHAFTLASDLKAVFLCNGANQTVIDKAGKLVGHDECDGTWRLDLASGRWKRIESKLTPPNRLDDAMCYCPDTRQLVYAGANRQLWLLDIKEGQWRQAKNSPPARTAMGQTIWHDPPRKRMLIVGGGRLDAWKSGPAAEFRELYAFDPAKETVERLADAPTALYSSHLAYDSKRDLFFTVAVFNGGEHASGMFAYDPTANKWQTVKVDGEIPPYRGWFGWMMLAYDSHHDCLIGKVRDKLFAFRYEPSND